ncbi:MAG: hypothetical protein Q8M08_03180, partial [Bacteroidales bacterium]|nr:hypothetical protein [Bacteroidales bacterium]
MKTQILLISFICMFAWSVQAQVQQHHAILPSSSQRVGSHFNPTQSGFKPDHLMVPAKRNMFNPSNSIWKWDTILSYNTASNDNPFQRISRTYNSMGEVLS